MSRNQTLGKKKRLAKHNRQTRWTPFWVVAKITGTLGKTHPSAFTTVKRQWRRGKTKV